MRKVDGRATVAAAGHTPRADDDANELRH